MSLLAGTRLGSYEILSPIGAGGMGEVYRARDPRLHRDVAIKALPASFATDGERVARFEREARLLAALNHPSIASIYGLEESGGAQFIVMELVEGGTLADRLKNGRLAVPDALRIARDVADALHAAHEKGIIHRDLKPANIALTPGGKPKVLDFGLAKAFSTDSTATTMDGATEAGVVLGTMSYMSPEQTRGAAVDKRTDIWAFGCVLYETLTARAPFGGTSASDVVVAVLEHDPDLNALPAATPARIRWLIRRCLEKDPARRLHDIADARIELEEALANPDASSGMSTSGTGNSRAGATSRERLAWFVAAVSLAALAAALLFNWRRPAEVGGTAEVFRSALVLPEDLRITVTDPAGRFAVSPDGRWLAVVAANTSGVQMLWIRPLDSSTAQPIAGTEGAAYPFWSPDGQSIGFIARSVVQRGIGPGARLRKVDRAAGQPVTLADVAFAATATWNQDNVILFTPTGNSPLFRVSASSPGNPVAVTALDADAGDVQHSFPSFLPDGRHYVYTALGTLTGANEARGVYIASLDGDTPPRLLTDAGSHGKYANGHLLFLRDARLLAQRLNLETLKLEGDAVTIAEGVQLTSRASGGTGAFSVSQTGVLIYQTGVGVRSQLAWIDRTGKVIRTVGEQADYEDVALSPDGSRALVSTLDPQRGTRDLRLYDVARDVHERFTAEPSDDFAPVWSRLGDRVAFTSTRAGSIEIYERSLSGAIPERKIESGGSRLGKFAATWSPDGSTLLFIAGGRALSRSDIHLTPMTGTGAPRPLIESDFVETQVRFSPDGRWIAFATNEPGEMQVYVLPFPVAGVKQRVSINGGGWPRWRSDGREIFFLAPRGTTSEYSLMAAEIQVDGATLKVGEPKRQFDVRVRPIGRLDAYSYDVASGGERFLFNTFVEEATSTGLTLVVNWPAALK